MILVIVLAQTNLLQWSVLSLFLVYILVPFQNIHTHTHTHTQLRSISVQVMVVEETYIMYIRE